ncbi:MAG: histidinol-phosphatase [Gammaproteobacteria bacterium]|jgi:myo-inositol-1(or 4)-monophosphatase|nr:histidinol-phosphatase [Gammaproteobacteria bacterium]
MLQYTEAESLRGERGRLLGFAIGVVEAAGQVALRYFRVGVSVENKADGGRFDPVTVADREAEKVLRERIRESFPEHGIYGEEFGHHQGNGLTWVIDPIDGTRAFMTGMLHWGVLLALFDGEKPVLGVMHQPFTGETFYGTNDSAYYRRGGEERALRCRSCESLESAVLTTTSPRFFDDPAHLTAFHRLEAQVKLTRYGGDCYIYAMLAMGMVDLATDSGLNAYDIQALMPIIRGAGGVVTTVDGGDPSMGGFVLAAGDARLHELALRRMAGDG